MKVKAYEGKEKFIFVSYAHKDSEQVLPIIQKMQTQGYRIWYDEGIVPGSEWPEDIANHLNDSAMVMAFISANSVASVNCRNEINFACSKNKPFLGIVLERAEMSLGMEMQLASKQCIFRYNFEAEQDFLDKVMKCPDLTPCRDAMPTEARKEEPKPAETSVTEKPQEKIEPTKQAEARKTAEISRNVEISKNTKKSEKTKPGQAKTKYIVLASVVAVVGLIIGLVCYNRIKINDKVTVSRGETYLTIKDETITAEQIAQLNKLKKLRYLEFTDCIFEENVFDGWETHEGLRSFTVNNTDTLTDYSFLQKQSGLEYLNLRACGLNNENFSGTNMNKVIRAVLEDNPEFTDLSMLNGESLTGLDISGTGVEDLSPLAGTKVKTLDFSQTKVSNVAPLSNLSELESLDGSGTAVSDIEALAVLQNLTEVCFNDCQITSINEKLLSLKLQKLKLANNGLQECAGLDYLTMLVEVDLSGNQLRNVDFLKKSAANLKVLDISDNDLDETEVAFLADCVNMESLCLNDLMLANLSFTSTMTNLKTISAIHCGLIDISALENSTVLENVRLALNDISDLSGLRNLKLTYGNVVDLAYNKITSLTGLPQGSYTILVLLGNDISFSDSALTGITGHNVVVNYREDLLNGEMANKPFYYYYLVDCPGDKQIETESALGKYSAHFVDENGALEFLKQKGVDYSQWLNVSAE